MKTDSKSEPPFGPPCCGVVPVHDLTGDDEEDTELLRQMAVRAHRYLESHNWCTCVIESYFGPGVGGVFAIFLFRIVPARPEIEDWIWVACGDLPSAYLPFEDAGSVNEVFSQYLDGMTRWVKFARAGGSELPADVPTINVPPTPEWADELERRLHSLREILAPFFA
jgi:hypothetical protein